MIQTLIHGNRRAKPKPRGEAIRSQQGFTLVEVMISMLILLGSFVALTSAFPLAALVHRSSLERSVALSLAQEQMEFYLANPGPAVGMTGTKNDFVNAGKFPPGYTGAIRAQLLAGGGGLVQIIISVTPPNAPKVEISAIDTTLAI